jgi:hypothetical protein
MHNNAEIVFGIAPDTLSLRHSCVDVCEGHMHDMSLAARMRNANIDYAFRLDNSIDYIGALLNDLIAMNKFEINEISYKTIHGEFQLEMLLDKYGGVHYSFRLVSIFYENQVDLRFQFRNDQTFLDSLVKQLKAFLMDLKVI